MDRSLGTFTSLGVIVSVLAVTVVLSLRRSKRDAAQVIPQSAEDRVISASDA